MKRYHIYDECVASDAALDHMPADPSREPAWSVQRARESRALQGRLIHQEEDFAGGPTLEIYDAGSHSMIDYAGWRFVCHARGVEYEGGDTRGIGLAEIMERVIAPWMMLSRRDSVLALHGGAVSHDRGSLVFMGESGVGKSSAALDLVRRGASLLSDDMALVDLDGVKVLPGAWTLRMWRQDAGEDLVDEGEIVGTSGDKHRFRYLRAKALVEGIPLVDVFELVRDESCAQQGEIGTLHGVRALGVLLGQCFDLSHATRAWSARRMALARRLLAKLGQVQQLRYATSATGEPVHAEALWRAIHG